MCTINITPEDFATLVAECTCECLLSNCCWRATSALHCCSMFPVKFVNTSSEVSQLSGNSHRSKVTRLPACTLSYLEASYSRSAFQSAWTNTVSNLHWASHKPGYKECNQTEVNMIGQITHQTNKAAHWIQHVALGSVICRGVARTGVGGFPMWRKD